LQDLKTYALVWVGGRNSYKYVESRYATELKIRYGHVARVKCNGSGAGKVVRIGIEHHRINDIERLILFALPGIRRLSLLNAMTGIVLRIPRLGGNADVIHSGGQVSKVIVALIVGGRLADRRRTTPALDKIFLEQHDRGVADRIIGFIADFSRHGSGGAQTKNQIFGFETRADSDRGRKVFVLLIHLWEVTTVTGSEKILAGEEAGEGKPSFRVCEFGASGIDRSRSIGGR